MASRSSASPPGSGILKTISTVTLNRRACQISGSAFALEGVVAIVASNLSGKIA